MKKIFYALLVKKMFLLFLVASMLGYQQQSYAQALPVANFVMNRAVAGVITKVALTRGFAANDARIAATMVGAGTAMSAVNVVSTVAGVGLTVAGAPVWLTIAGGLAVLAVGAAIVAGGSSISIDSTSMGNKLRVDSPAPAPVLYSAPPMVDQSQMWQRALLAGAPIYRDAMACYGNDACYALPLLPPTSGYKYSSDPAGKTWLFTSNLNDFGLWYTFLNKPILSLPDGVIFNWNFAGAVLNYNSMGGSQVTVSIAEGRSGGDSVGLPSYSRVDVFNNVGSVVGSIGSSWYNSLNDAVTAIPAAVNSSKVSSDTLARIVDKAWQAAAMQPGYQGLPYSFSQPVTAVDVDPWAMANPASVPTVADMLVPASNPGTNTVPISPTVTPGTSTPPVTYLTVPPATSSNVNVVNTPNVNVTNQVQVDLGPNPNIGTPSLESTPTAQAVLQPILNLFPSLRTFVVPSHSSECPKPSFSMFNKTIVMDSHCSLLDGAKPILSAVMVFVWVVVGLFIVLAA